MKRAISAVVAVAFVVATLGATALAAPAANPTLVISHKVKGCHIWALNGRAPAVNQVVKLHPGQSFIVRNVDVMPHQLVKTSGGAVTMKLVVPGMMGASTGMMKAPYPVGMMPHMSSVMRVTVPKTGVYWFKTVAGEDYTANVKTVGEDNVLKVKVVVG
jgi:hypothetical protein